MALGEAFAIYAFNKSHSTAYALIAYQTAYLKAHFKVEFMAALLSGDIPGRNFKRKDSLVEHLEDCERMGIVVVHPDVNSSDVDFTVADGKIMFGLSAVKGCGGGAAEAISAARRKDGPFIDLFDFCERVETSACNRSTLSHRKSTDKSVSIPVADTIRPQMSRSNSTRSEPSSDVRRSSRPHGSR